MEVLTGFSNEIFQLSNRVDNLLVEEISRLNKHYKAEEAVIEKLYYFRDRALDAYSRMHDGDMDVAHYNQEIAL